MVTNSDVIQLEDLPSVFLQKQPVQDAISEAPASLSDGLDQLVQTEEQIPELADVEAMLLRRAIDVCDGNLQRAARRLGISRATIYRRLERLGITRS